MLTLVLTEDGCYTSSKNPEKLLPFICTLKKSSAFLKNSVSK
jgi:hypothetical protein